MYEKKFSGTGVALVTPFTQDDQIDFLALEKLIEHVISEGVDFLVALGTTAETPTLSVVEKISLLEFIKEKNNKRVPLVCGIGGNNTSKVVQDLKEFPLQGVDAILSVNPYYNKPNVEGLYQHYKEICANTDKDIIVYNVPGRTGSNISVQTVLRLATDFKNIIGIKEAAGNMEQSMQLIASLPPEFVFLSGDDNLVLPQIACGFDGVISVAANCYTKAFTDLVNAAMNNDYTKARELHYTLLPAIDLLFVEGNPAGVKCVLKEMGIVENIFRLPVAPVSTSTHEKIRMYLNSYGN